MAKYRLCYFNET